MHSAAAVRILTLVAVAGSMAGCGSHRDAAATGADAAALRACIPEGEGNHGAVAPPQA